MDKQVKKFLESLVHGPVASVSYKEYERWVRARATDLLDKEPAKTLRFYEYYNSISGERSRWARDDDNQVMVSEHGTTWNLYGAGSFFTSGWSLSSPSRVLQLDIDALKRQVTALDSEIAKLLKSVGCIWDDSEESDKRIEALESKMSTVLNCIPPATMMERVECLEANSRALHTQVERQRNEFNGLSDLTYKQVQRMEVLRASSKLETVRLSDLARKVAYLTERMLCVEGDEKE